MIAFYSMKMLYLLIIFAFTVKANSVNDRDESFEDISNYSEDDPNSFAKQWEERMANYEPEYVYMLELPFKKNQVYYENIKSVPMDIKGAFLVSEDSKEKIDFLIYNPLGTVLYRSTDNEHIFEFTAQEPGLYKIVFNNKYVNSPIRVTFTMNAGHNVMLKKTDLSPVEEKLDKILSFTQKFNMEMKINRNIHEDRYKSA